jgi:hypothetical protein
MKTPLLIYRISGWTINLVTILLAFVAIKTPKLWEGKYIFLGIWFVALAITELASSITALYSINNLFLDYIYGSISFSMKSIYLSRQHKSKVIHWFGYFSAFVFIGMQLFKAFDKEGYKSLNTLGAFSGTTFFLIFTVFNLTILFLERNANRKLRNNPDFWFTATMFCFAFLGLIITVIADTSYAAQSEMVLYVLYISENFIKSILYYGYYRGIKLLT